MAELKVAGLPAPGKAVPYPLSGEESDKVYSAFCKFDDALSGLKKLSELLDKTEDYGTAGIIAGLLEYMQPAVDDLDVLLWNVRRHTGEKRTEVDHG